MDHADQLDRLGSEIAAMAAATAGADLSAPVPTCPGWTVAEAIRHTGGAHRWAAHIVRTRASERVGWKAVETGLPETESALPDWLAAGAAPLLAELAADPATAVWSFAPGGSVGWWTRRMVHETAVHRADVALALGRDPSIDSAVAVDGVDELLGTMLPAVGGPAKVRALDRAGDSLHLHATDAPGEWTISLTEEGYDWAAAHTKATVAVRGSASDLLLLLWNRRSLADADRFEVFGDGDLLDAWTKATGF
ncbi:MAG: maleylpyruvate isomerase family mycothiol-dependent enzyme [Sporichthyaceae bacterium]